MAVIGRVRHVAEGEFDVVASFDSLAVGAAARAFTSESEALTFLYGVVAAGGTRQLGDIYYHVDIGGAREFGDAEAMTGLASLLAADAIRLLRDPWLGEGVVHHPAAYHGYRRRESLVGTVIHTTRGVGDGFKNEIRQGKKAWHFTVDRDGTVYQHVGLNRVASHAGDSELRLSSGAVIKNMQVSERTIGIEIANMSGLLKTAELGPAALAEVRKHDASCGDKWCKRSIANAKGGSTWRVWVGPKDGGGVPAKVGHAIEPAFVPKKADFLPIAGEKCPAWWEEFPKEQILGLLRLLRLIREAGYPEATQRFIRHSEIATNPKGRKVDPGPVFPWERLPRAD